jgi:hypothetical protein
MPHAQEFIVMTSHRMIARVPITRLYSSPRDQRLA